LRLGDVLSVIAVDVPPTALNGDSHIPYDVAGCLS
jgi:hypothetical protein